MDLIYGKNIYTDNGVLENGYMGIERGHIKYLGEEKIKCDGRIYDFSNYDIFPSLVDIHTHGAIGIDANKATAKDFITLAKYNAKSGISAFMPTAVTDSYDNIEKILIEIKKAMDMQRKENCYMGAEILGLFLEGIFINPLKKGSHIEKYIKEIDLDFLEYISGKYNGVLKRMIIAPELENSEKAVKILRDRGVFVCMGHSVADYESTIKGIKNGIQTAVHIFNAMGEFNHRKTGILTASLLEDIYTEAICDFVHTDKNAMRLLLKCKNWEKIILVTDSVCAKGIENKKCYLGEAEVSLKDNIAVLDDGTIAGGTSDIIDGVRNMVSLGVPKEKAMKMGNLNPLKSIGKKLRFEVGAKANFIVCDEKLNIINVFMNGKEINKK